MNLNYTQLSQLQLILNYVASIYDSFPQECSVNIKTDCTDTNIFVEIPAELSHDFFDSINVLHQYNETDNITKCVLLK
jgi:hypothetical protein